MILGAFSLAAVPLAGAIGETLASLMFDASEFDISLSPSRAVIPGDILAIEAANIRITVLYDGYSVDVFNQIGITVL